MVEPTMIAGKPGEPPAAINWWVDVSQRSIIVRAEHSADAAGYQNVLIIERGPEGFSVSSRNLFARQLCEALGVSFQSSLPVSNEAPKEVEQP